MISPVTLSVIFLIFTLFIVLGWTHVIFGSTKEEEEMLRTLKLQMSTLASIKEETLNRNTDSLIENLINNDLDDSSLETRTGRNSLLTGDTLSTSLSTSIDSSNETDEQDDSKIDDKLNKYLNEINSMIKQKCKAKKPEDKQTASSSKTRKVASIFLNNSINIQIKKSKSVISHLDPKRNQICRIPVLNTRKLKECAIERIFLPTRSISDVGVSEIGSKKTNVTRKSSYTSKDTGIATRSTDKHDSESSDNTSSSGNSLPSKNKKSNIRRHRSLTDKTRSKKPTIYLRATSSDETLMKKSSKHISRIEKKSDCKIKQAGKQLEESATCSSSYIRFNSRSPNKRRRKKGSPYGKSPINLKQDIYPNENSSVDFHTNQTERRKSPLKENNIHLPSTSFDWKGIYQANFPKNQTQYTVQLLSELGPSTNSALYQNKFQKMPENGVPPKCFFQEKPAQKHRPSSPNRHSNLLSNLNQFPGMKERNCISDGANERPTSNSSSVRSKSFNHINSFIEPIENESLSSNAYDLSLIVLDTNNFADVARLDAPQNYVQFPLTVDRSTEMSKSPTQQNLLENLKKNFECSTDGTQTNPAACLCTGGTQTAFSKCDCCTDSTQTSFPKLKVQHLESYSAPVNKENCCCSEPNLEIKENENTSKIPRLTMPDVKLEKLSNTLRRSRNIIETKRNIIEELVKETRHLLCEQVNKSQEIKIISRKQKFRSRIPRSPTSSLNNSPKHSPNLSPNLSLISTPSGSKQELNIAENTMIKKRDHSPNMRGAGEQMNESLVLGIIEEACITNLEMPKAVNLHLKSEIKALTENLDTLPPKPKPRTIDAKNNTEKNQDTNPKPIEKSGYKNEQSESTYKSEDIKCEIIQNSTRTEIKINEKSKPKSPSKKERKNLSPPRSKSPKNTSRDEKHQETLTDKSKTIEDKPVISKETKTAYTAHDLPEKRSTSPNSKRPSNDRQKDSQNCSYFRSKSPKQFIRNEFIPPISPDRTVENIDVNIPSRYINYPMPEAPEVRQKCRKKSHSPCYIPLRTEARPRSPITTFVRPPSPMLMSRKDRSPSPPSTFKTSTTSKELEESVYINHGIEPSRHDMACSTSYLNKNHMSTQCAQGPVPGEHNRRSRWAINRDMKNYPSYNYGTFYDQWYFTQPPVMAPNFYCVNDYVRQAPFMPRSLSPVQNPNLRANPEAFKKMMHAKDIASRLNR